ncbi:MAG: class I adenylate cyclase [Gammaproteobacteria bacterium]|nr:class I adenylate cyclase [Gammaproteobacteria bacterium]
MTRASTTAFDFSIESAIRRFPAVNRDRLNRVTAVLSARQAEFLDLLPLLFHTNHPLLPGYVSRETPFGIADYSPTQAALRAVRRLSRALDIERRSPPRLAVRGLYLMGSPGSIAFSRDSDLDMWLVHDPELATEGVAELAEKARRIEAFAAELGLEVHFFVLDAERFRRGQTLSLSAESSGSSQHYVLLDEFYRSAVLLAGLPPLWWRVPTCYDADYDAFIAEGARRRVFDARDFIDFGGLPRIPAEEFFGAAVWQLYKSIDSPYKSVLKLLLMEAYAAEYPDITLLCARYKGAIEQGESDLNVLDPYIMMYTKVEEHLMARNDATRLDVMRRCFYLKAGLRVSEYQPQRDEDDWRAGALHHLVEAWGWSQGRTVMLDQRDHWGLTIAMEERQDLTATLRSSYAFLSRFARNHATDLKITERDLHVLGRKLYAAFEKKQAKIEVITRGICTHPEESNLSLHETHLGDDTAVWLLFAGTVTPAEAAFKNPLRRSASATEMVVWCHLNRLADRATNWHVFAASGTLNGNDTRRLLDNLQAALPADGIAHGNDDLAAPARLARVLLLVNVGINPFAGAIAEGSVLTSDHNDPYQFAGRRFNLIRSIDLVFVTSWNETFVFRHEGGAALLEALRECLAWLPPGSGLPPVEARCFGADHANLIADRVQQTFDETLRFVARVAPAATAHFVLETADALHHLRVGAGTPQIASHANTGLLMRALGEGSGETFQRVRFDRGCQRAALLAALYRHNRPGVLQIFALPRGPRADVYIVDERGLLLAQRQDCYTVETLLQHYQQFLDSALAHLPATDGATTPPTIETCEVEIVGGTPRFKPHTFDSVTSGGYLPLRVLADADSNGRQQFTIIAGTREFSTWEHGGSLFRQVAEYVLAQRADGVAYPIYITDLDLSARFRQVSGISALRAFDLLSYKKRIEVQLTRALSSEHATNVVSMVS